MPRVESVNQNRFTPARATPGHRTPQRTCKRTPGAVRIRGQHTHPGPHRPSQARFESVCAPRWDVFWGIPGPSGPRNLHHGVQRHHSHAQDAALFCGPAPPRLWCRCTIRATNPNVCTKTTNPKNQAVRSQKKVQLTRRFSAEGARDGQPPLARVSWKARRAVLLGVFSTAIIMAARALNGVFRRLLCGVYRSRLHERDDRLNGRRHAWRLRGIHFLVSYSDFVSLPRTCVPPGIFLRSPAHAAWDPCGRRCADAWACGSELASREHIMFSRFEF